MSGLISLCRTDESRALADAYKKALEQKGYAVEVKDDNFFHNDGLPEDGFQLVEFTGEQGSGSYKIAFAETVDGFSEPQPWGMQVTCEGEFNPLKGQTIEV